jgi:hypothetical protein
MRHSVSTKTAVLAVALVATSGAAGSDARADDSPDLAFAKRMFVGSVGKPKAYACFVRRYDTEHVAQHPLQKVSVMKLLITAEKMPDDANLNYSFRLGVNFRNRPGDFDSSGECGHAPTVKAQETDAQAADAPAAGIDFSCNVDCDGGGIAVNLAKDNGLLIVKLDGIRIWKGKDPDESAVTELKGGADDKVFRLDRTKVDECAALVADRKELAAMRHK